LARNPILQKAPWIESEHIRPYVFVRPENRITYPGQKHHLDWFQGEPIYKNPLHLDQLEFAEQIYFLEGNAFGPSNMAIPRWVFYDCAVVPGIVAGFAYRTEKLPEAIKKVMRTNPLCEWTPLSLFVIIPTIHRGEWVAHNLCSINTLLEKADQFYGIGFLSKAFGLWYANVELCTGMTQWGSPALKLHANYGHMEIIGAYAPVHTHARTLTYRVVINTLCWEQFFKREADYGFLENYEATDRRIDPKDEKSMIELQKSIENAEGPFFLNAAEVAVKKIDDILTVYREKARYF
jgi:hypothetical protein